MPKRSFKEGAAFYEKLASAKSLKEAVEVRTRNNTKTAYETLVTESKKIVEMYAELSRNHFKPFGTRENALPGADRSITLQQTTSN